MRLRTMLDVLHHDGQPSELAWPYSRARDPYAAKWEPPPNVGELFRATARRVASDDVDAVRAAIDRGCPVVMVLAISEAFFFGGGDEGVIDSAEAVDGLRFHAVLAVAHGSHTGESVTLVRNSWGTSWGLNGHAWLTDRYLKPRLREWATLTKVT